MRSKGVKSFILMFIVHNQGNGTTIENRMV